MSYDYLFKLIFIGEPRVGKTSYADRLVDDKYKNQYGPTLGVDFYSKHITLDDNVVIKNHIWDTAGQEKFSPLIRNYYKGIAGAVIMFDITNRNSFNKVRYWITQLDANKDTDKYIPVIVIGNKIDKEDRKVSRKEAEHLAYNNDMLYDEISCKSGINLEESFKRIVIDIYARMDKEALGPGIRRHFSQENISYDEYSQEPLKVKQSCCSII